MESLLPLISFAFVASITPGPNNLMLSASGVAFGMRRSLPHILGTICGFVLLLIACGSGIGALLVEYPSASLALKTLGSAYLLYLAWALRGAFVTESAGAEARPLTFLQAFLFQFANPKGWVMALTAASIFMPTLGSSALVAICLVFVGVGVPCILFWTGLGVTARHFLSGPRQQSVFALLLGVMMLATVTMIWL